MGKIIKIEDVPLNEEILLKKDIFGYRIVYPIKNSDGSVNYSNLLFGGWRNFFFLLFLLALVGFLMWSNYHDYNQLKDFYSNISADPYYACRDILAGQGNDYSNNINKFTINIENVSSEV